MVRNLQFQQLGRNTPPLLEKVGQRWDEFQNLHRFDNLYDFEKEYAKLAMELNREMLEAILGQVPKDHQKKTNNDSVWHLLESCLLESTLTDNGTQCPSS